MKITYNEAAKCRENGKKTLTLEIIAQLEGVDCARDLCFDDEFLAAWGESVALDTKEDAWEGTLSAGEVLSAFESLSHNSIEDEVADTDICVGVKYIKYAEAFLGRGYQYSLENPQDYNADDEELTYFRSLEEIKEYQSLQLQAWADRIQREESEDFSYYQD